MLLNIKKNQNLIGAVGEIIAKYYIKNCVRTSEMEADDFIKRFEDYLEERQKDFLRKYWHKVDIVKINDRGLLELYEVKTKKYFYRKLKPLHYKLKVTKYSLEAYKKAKELGIAIYLVRVTLFENWRCGVLIEDFDFKKNILVDKRDKPFKNRL